MDNQSIPSLLHCVTSRLDSHCNQILFERLGIGLSQFRVLLLLQDRDGRVQRDVAQNLFQTEASISRQVKIMLAKGLISVRPNPRNRREHLLFLTHKGDRLSGRAIDILNNYLATKFAAISEKEQAQLRSSLLKINGVI